MPFPKFDVVTGGGKIMVQKVVIPKEAVNPDDTIVIEIPRRLRSVPILLATRQPPRMEEILNTRWNGTERNSTLKAAEQSELIDQTEKNNFIDVNIQTSVTEIDTSVQANFVTWSQTSLPLKFQKLSDWDYAYAPQRTPVDIERMLCQTDHRTDPGWSQPILESKEQDCLAITPHETRLGQSKDEEPQPYLIETASSIFLESVRSNHEWSKHDCNIQQELTNLLTDVEESFGKQVEASQ
ncbi:hypothetical protein HHI36_007283 [Cryptolaemus montrouzieri]|uniref:Uncharacterized protein n=1 Tax=Cryptolaemus montrouzieri TaxID=559131 RepID=A0ABD2MP32_9CUCU